VSPTWATLLFEAANFVVLAAFLGWLFFRPVRDALEQRREGLEAADREAAEKLERAQRALSDAEARRGEVESDLASLRKRVHDDAEKERLRLLDSAREQARRERDALESELASLRRGQAKRVANDAAAAAREIVVRLLERIEGPDLEQALAEAATRELAELASSGSLRPLLVESSRALSPDTRDAIGRAAGLPGSELDVRVVPDLGAGLRILTARGVVDASAAGLAAHAERVLAGRLAVEEAGGG
jgi:F-type H+-transporting ATPase subunit b